MLEALNSDKAAAPKTAKAAASKAAPVPEAPKAKKAASSDDLKRIEGIGPKINDALLAAGITTFAELADSSEEALKAALESAGLRFAPSLSTWAEQAGYLARGDEAGFIALTERLVAGRAASTENGEGEA
ncbi:MAG: helix-hairpin-helix domain-containing protein [Deinococcales bacterium]